MKFTKSVIAAILFASGVSGFANGPSVSTKSSTSLQMISDDGMKKAVTSFVAAAFLMGNVAAVAPAFAVDDMDFGSSQVIAGRSGGRGGGRSGGRAGGRSSAPRAAAAPSRSTTNTRVIERTTIVAPPTVMYGSPMYNPYPGLGLSLGLNAVNQIGNNMRDNRQEGEIQRTRSELQQTQMREQQMEERMRQMEMQQQLQALTPEQQVMLLRQIQQQQAVPAN